MLIEAVEAPIRYQWPHGEILLEPGKPVEVDELRGLKVLAKCNPKVRMVPQEGQPLTGKIVHFSSPLFGECTGRVVMEEGEMVVVDDHSVLHKTVTIPRDWVRSLKYDAS